MLETIRQYALERLAASVEADAVQTAACGLPTFSHAGGRDAQLWFGHAKESAWLDRLEIEHDNLRAALRLGRSAAGIAELGARLAVSLAGLDWRSFWSVRGYWSEGRRWLETVLEQRNAIAPTIRARAIIQTGFCVGAGSVEVPDSH